MWALPEPDPAPDSVSLAAGLCFELELELDVEPSALAPYPSCIARAFGFLRLRAASILYTAASA